jgi:hypothetical protein
MIEGARRLLRQRITVRVGMLEIERMARMVLG